MWWTLLFLPWMLMSPASPQATMATPGAMTPATWAVRLQATLAPLQRSTASPAAWTPADVQAASLDRNLSSLDALKTAKLPVIRFDLAFDAPRLSEPVLVQGQDLSAGAKPDLVSTLNPSAVTLDDAGSAIPLALALGDASAAQAVYADLRVNPGGQATKATSSTTGTSTTDTGSGSGASSGSGDSGPSRGASNPTGVGSGFPVLGSGTGSGSIGSGTDGGGGGITLTPEPTATWPLALLALPLARRSRRAALK